MSPAEVLILEQKVLNAAAALEREWTNVRRFEAQKLIDAVIDAAAKLREAQAEDEK